MGFEVQYHLGEPLLKEFFPGNLMEDEQKWWVGSKDPYGSKRDEEKWRGHTPKPISPDF
ncbi:hypothetical protein AB5N19_14522 [Seiridium cardinale]